MNTKTGTTRYLNIDLLSLGDLAPTLMPGDTVHLEATLKVRSVSNGLNYMDDPTETVTLAPIERDAIPQAVIRVANLQVVPGLVHSEPLTERIAVPVEYKPSIRERITGWRNAHRVILGALGGTLALGVWIASIAALVFMLMGCSMVGYAKVGDPCTTIGSENRTKNGSVLICKAPTKSDPTGVNRWRKA